MSEIRITISCENYMRTHMRSLLDSITISCENYMRTHMRSLLDSVTISYEISYNIFTRDTFITL